MLHGRLRDALTRLNPWLSVDALADAIRRITNPDGVTLEARNRSFHLNLINGVTVERRTPEGTVSRVPAKVIDLENPDENNWLAVNQLTAQENLQSRRGDIRLFVNGLSLGVIELKNPADESTYIWEAWQQIQNYQVDLPTMFSMNEFQIISDGILARIGPLNAGTEWFKPWRTMEGEEPDAPALSELQTMLEGTCEPARFLTLVRDFIVAGGGGVTRRRGRRNGRRGAGDLQLRGDGQDNQKQNRGKMPGTPGPQDLHLPRGQNAGNPHRRT